MWPLSTEPRPVRPSDTTSAGRTAHPGVVGCRFRPQGASAVGVHKASLTPPVYGLIFPKETQGGTGAIKRPKDHSLFHTLA